MHLVVLFLPVLSKLLGHQNISPAMTDTAQNNNATDADRIYIPLSGKSSESSKSLGDALVRIASGGAELVIRDASGSEVTKVPGDLLQALSMRALAWYIDHQCLNTNNAQVVFVTTTSRLQNPKGSEHPALALPIVRDLADQVEALDDQVRGESDFAAYMSRSGQYYEEKLYPATWRVWLFRVIACGIFSNILITAARFWYNVSTLGN
ncbi:hypothetical protein C8Q76DRAFT_792241 [Earliella scabrosa]|nr:hypothetical protein C8Q76DRAFT_792241 [Earliella scabrosa]